MAAPKQTSASEELQYASGNLRRETGWWGAFVIGLAGTILVTGIAPVMVTQLGASGIPVTQRSKTAGQNSPSTSTALPPGPIGSDGSLWRRSI
jgi:hypothetical protein